MRVVFDTNILVLYLLGDPATAIMEAAFTGFPVERLSFFYSEAMHTEYREVLAEVTSEDPVTFNPERAAHLLADITTFGHLVHPTIALDICSHEPDNRFLECAVSAGTDYLVTVNTRHFPGSYRGVEVLLPHQFYHLLFAG